MVEITIPEGETERLIPDDQANRDYYLSVENGPLRLAHDARYATEGARYETGDRGRLTNLADGNGRPQIFAHAPNGHGAATVSLERAQFLFDLFNTSARTPQAVGRPKDDAAERNLTDAVGDTVNVVAGSMTRVRLYTNDGGDFRAMSQAFGTPLSDLPGRYRFYIEDSNQNELAEWPIWAKSLPSVFEPEVVIPEDHSLYVDIANYGSSDENFAVSVSIRGSTAEAEQDVAYNGI